MAAAVAVAVLIGTHRGLKKNQQEEKADKIDL